MSTSLSESSFSTVHDSSFESEVLRSKKPIAITFAASWSSACEAFEPTFSQIAEEFQDRVKAVWATVDEAPHTAAHFELATLPTTLFLFEGSVIHVERGLIPKTQLRHLFETLFADHQ